MIWNGWRLYLLLFGIPAPSVIMLTKCHYAKGIQRLSAITSTWVRSREMQTSCRRRKACARFASGYNHMLEKVCPNSHRADLYSSVASPCTYIDVVVVAICAGVNDLDIEVQLSHHHSASLCIFERNCNFCSCWRYLEPSSLLIMFENS